MKRWTQSTSYDDNVELYFKQVKRFSFHSFLYSERCEECIVFTLVFFFFFFRELEPNRNDIEALNNLESGLGLYV